MQEASKSLLSAWESFYVIVGSSGAALTGLQFVVIALITDTHAKSTNREIDTFGTPTIVHFCAVLLIAAALSAPWQALSSVSLFLGACGVAGIIYGLVIIKRARTQIIYKPVLEDWIWHIVLPITSYVALLISAILVRNHGAGALFIVAAVTLLLLFIGIHNAWDTVTYVAFTLARQDDKSSESEET